MTGINTEDISEIYTNISAEIITPGRVPHLSYDGIHGQTWNMGYVVATWR